MTSFKIAKIKTKEIHKALMEKTSKALIAAIESHEKKLKSGIVDWEDVISRNMIVLKSILERNQKESFSIEELLEFLMYLDHDVDIVVKEKVTA